MAKPKRSEPKLPESWPATHVEHRPLAKLLPYAQNPRLHSDEQVTQLSAAIKEYGWTMPCLIDEEGEVIAGHGRILAASRLGITAVPVMVARGWSEAQRRAYRIWDNQSTLLGTWDTTLLATELRALEQADYPLMMTGFDEGQLVQFMAMLDPVPSDPPIPPVPKNPVSQIGDLWQLGDHQILCGDCRSDEDVKRLIADRGPINVAVTSPPYAEQRQYDESSGFKPIPPAEYVGWFAPVVANIARHLASDGSWFLNIKPCADELDTDLYVFDLVIAHVREWGWHFATEFCWERGGVPKHVVRRFKNQFEPIYQFSRGDWKIRPQGVMHESQNVPIPYGPGSGSGDWSVTQGQKGGDWRGKNRKKPRIFNQGRRSGHPNDEKLQGTSWQSGAPLGIPAKEIGEGMAFPGNRLPTFSHTHEASGHPAAFPVGLPAFFIRAYSDRGDLIYDPFLGSGSTLLAADQYGRIARGMELSAGYVDVAVERWQNHTGGQAQRLKKG